MSSLLTLLNSVFCGILLIITWTLSHSQFVDPFNNDNACARSTDAQTKVEITHVQYRHRFQVTAVLEAYPYDPMFEDSNSTIFTEMAMRFENEVKEQLELLDSQNTYQSLVFLILPYRDTTKIECLVSAAQTKLKTVDVTVVMRRMMRSTEVSHFQNMVVNVSNEVQYCLQEIIIPPNGTLTWPTTAINTEAYTLELCPVGTEFAGEVSLGSRQCLPTGCIKDSQSPERRVCHGAWQPFRCDDCGNVSVNALLAQLATTIDEPGADILLICQQALHITGIAEGLSEPGVESITIMVQFITSHTTPIPLKNAQCATRLIGNVLLLGQDIIAAAEMRIQSASGFLQSLNDLLIFTDVDEQLLIITTNLAVGLIDIDLMNNQWYGFGSSMNTGLLTSNVVTLNISDQPVWMTEPTDIQTDTYVYLLIEDQETSVTAATRAVFTLHQTSQFYQQLSDPQDVDGYFATQLNSRIISVNTPSVIPISDPTISIAFKMVDGTGVNQSCVTWVASPDGIFGDWSEDGCFVDSLQDELTICQCDHLGSFALLSNIQYRKPPVERAPPVLLGGFVIFAGVVGFLTFIFMALVIVCISSLRVRRELQLLAILFFDLAALYLVFAIAITKTEQQAGCLVGGAIVYFCFISAFMWMAIWASNMYEYSRQKYIQVKWFVRKAALLGFGIPAGLTIILIVTNPYVFFDTRSMCFLSGNPAYIMVIALILPIGISLVITILLFIISHINYPALETLDSNVPKPKVQRLVLRKKRMYLTAIVFGAILFTVGFLLLAVYQRSIAAQVIFALVTVAQGVLIIFAYCYRDEEIKIALVAAIKRSKPKEEGSYEPKFESKFQSYWSNANWNGGSTSKNGTAAPTRFLDDSARTAPLTPQHFNPDSIPMTALEKKRLSKVLVNGDAVKEAVIVRNHDGQIAEVIRHNGAIRTAVNGTTATGPDSNGNSTVVLHEDTLQEAESKV